MSAELSISVEGVEQLRRRFRVLLDGSGRRRMNEHIGRAVLEGVKDHLAEMSVSRHKVADRLGSTKTGYFENAPGRTELTQVDEGGLSITIRNTPGLRRAYGPMHIAPTGGRKFLTIPIHRISAHKRVADLKGEGHEVFRPWGWNALGEYDGSTEEYTDRKTGKRRKRKRIRPLYALVRSVTVPQDEGLLPKRERYVEIARDAAEGFLEAESP